MLFIANWIIFSHLKCEGCGVNRMQCHFYFYLEIILRYQNGPGAKREVRTGREESVGLTNISCSREGKFLFKGTELD